MDNETLALLTPLAIFVAMAGTGALLSFDIVRRHPAKDPSRKSAGKKEHNEVARVSRN